MFLSDWILLAASKLSCKMRRQDDKRWFDVNAWSGRRGSNPRHPAWEADVLPLNYSRSQSMRVYHPVKLASNSTRRLGINWIVLREVCSICRSETVVESKCHKPVSQYACSGIRFLTDSAVLHGLRLAAVVLIVLGSDVALEQ